MKISVLIIAHNEEEHIEKCITSILNQSQIPDEVLLLAHNCTDDTVKIAKKFPKINIVEYNGLPGPMHARIAGFESVNSEIVCSIDGDAWAHKDWVKNITTPLLNNKKITLSYGRVVFENNIFWKLAMVKQYLIRKLFSKKYGFASGACFAVRIEDYKKVGGIAPLVDLKQKLNLYFDAEDYYISQALKQIGKINLVWNAKVYSYVPKEKASVNAQIDLVPKWNHDNNKINEYFKNKMI